MKRSILTVGGLLLTIEAAVAEDFGRLYMVIPMAGGALGLVIGIGCISDRFRERRRAIVWLALPLYVLAGSTLAAGGTMLVSCLQQDRVVCSFGRVDSSADVTIQVPCSFGPPETDGYHRQLNSHENVVLSSRKFGVRLVRQSDGFNRLDVTVNPSIPYNDSVTHRKVRDEIFRQADIALKLHAQRMSAQK